MDENMGSCDGLVGLLTQISGTEGSGRVMACAGESLVVQLADAGSELGVLRPGMTRRPPSAKEGGSRWARSERAPVRASLG